MSNHKVDIAVTAGPMKGKAFSFDEHDTFIFGRLEKCHCCLPTDGQVSRRHFIVEVNPPDACIRDFGSLNGTYINEKKEDIIMKQAKRKNLSTLQPAEPKLRRVAESHDAYLPSRPEK